MTSSPSSGASIELVSADLLFTSKVGAAGKNLNRTVRICNDPSQVAASHADLIIVDLATPRLDIAAFVRRVREKLGEAPIIAFGRHTDRPQREAAAAAGCTEVLARSEFVENLAEILQRASVS